MGSLDRGVLTGFICRLCSEMHRIVIHIYGDEGTRLCISEKISRHLTINISRSDPLPKTICKNCLERLENQHRLMMVMEHAKNVLKAHQQRGRLGHNCYIGQCKNNNSDDPPITK